VIKVPDDFFDPLRDIFHVSEQERKALESASSIISSVASVWGVINSVKSTLTTLGVLDQADPVEALRGHIDQLVRDFHGVAAALDRQHSMRAVAEQLSSARTQLLNLTEHAPNDASSVGVDPVWDELRPFVLNNSLQAVVTLGDPAYWQRVFIPELTYQKWHPQQLRPTPAVSGSAGLPSGLVYDYRLTLPAYLEAISIRLTIVVAIVKNYRTAMIPELNLMITTLEDNFKKIRGGIWDVLWAPTLYDDNLEFPFNGVGSWIESGARVGAVEIYSAVDVAFPWPMNTFPLVDIQYDGNAETAAKWYKFLVQYAVRNWVRWKMVYDLVGLNAVADTIMSLKRIAGRTNPADLPDPEVGPDAWEYTVRKIKDGKYSLRELAQMIHDLGAYGQWGFWPLLDGEQHRLVNPISLREMLKLMQTFNPAPYTSFRKALSQ
jgi:hypothetical protein